MKKTNINVSTKSFTVKNIQFRKKVWDFVCQRVLNDEYQALYMHKLMKRVQLKSMSINNGLI